MRTLCDVCESAAAILFCAADEAALCRSCDNKVHMCNKLASRHVRVGLASPSAVPRCDICESSPAFFYCEVDGSSLCLQCDMSVHVGGKRTHGRFLLLRQKVEFPGDKTPGGEESTALLVDDGEDKIEPVEPVAKDSRKIQRVASIPISDGSSDGEAKMEIQMFDLNMKPSRQPGQESHDQE